MVDISTATAIVGQVQSVTIASAPVVTFTVTDQNGAALSGLKAYDSAKRIGIRFGIATLLPGANGGASQWYSYFTRSVTSGTCPSGATCVSYPAGSGVTQAAVDSAGTLTFDATSGTYTYTFSKDVTTDPKYSAAGTHRVAFQINGYAPANNGAFTFRPDGVKTMLTRDIVSTATCNTCHERLSAHGGARVEVEYCVVCHSPQTTDYYSGNTVDMKVMVHKIHMGENLPSINTGSTPDTTPKLGQGYWVGGSNFNEVLYPQDVRNCDTCHVTGAGAPNDAMNYTAVPSIEACGACHDTINFATGAGHSTGNIVADNSMCATCHVNSSPSLQAANAHAIPEVVEAANYQYKINSVTFVSDAGGTKYPAVNFTIVNPTAGAAKAYWNILTDTPFVGVVGTTPVCTSAARLAIDIGWETSDYTNWITGWTAKVTATSNPAQFLANLGVSTWGQPVSLNPIVPGAGGVPASCSSSTLVYDAANVTPPAAYAPPAAPKVGTLYGPDTNGAFTVVGPALPTPPAATCADGNACAAVQNIAVVLEGHPGVQVTTGAAAARIPVKNAIAYQNTGTATAVVRRKLVDIAKCDVCHKQLSLHGSNRTDDTQVCVVCHNPASTDYNQRTKLGGPGIDGLFERPIDFKYMIHGIHNGENLAAAGMPFVVYGFGGGATDFSGVKFPEGNEVGNCNACHINNSFMPGVDPLSQAMTTTTGLGLNFPTATTGNPVSTSPTMAACTGCHQTDLEISHMLQNGGATTVTKDQEGRMFPASNPAGVETCSVCHGSGALADVSKVHPVAP